MEKWINETQIPDNDENYCKLSRQGKVEANLK